MLPLQMTVHSNSTAVISHFQIAELGCLCKIVPHLKISCMSFCSFNLFFRGIPCFDQAKQCVVVLTDDVSFFKVDTALSLVLNNAHVKFKLIGGQEK